MQERCSPRTILFVCTEDWFFHSHFLPLVKAVRQVDENTRIVLATKVNNKGEALARRGIEVIPCDLARGSIYPLAVWQSVRCLRNVVQSVRPDIVHCIALRTILTAVLARLKIPNIIFHFTGLGTLAESDTLHIRTLRTVLLRQLAWHVRRQECALLFENPDDREYLVRYGLPAETTTIFLGGAGVDPNRLPALPDPDKHPVHAAFVGRLIATKGVDVLVQAMEEPALRKIGVQLDIYGDIDPANPGAYDRRSIEAWASLPFIHWHGTVDDILDVWRRAAICVHPTRTREGMPRSILEAAACARPLVVTDVPGSKHFVRNGVEGFVVPPANPQALARAIARLAQDRALRERMGSAARARILSGFTEEEVMKKVVDIYQEILKKK